MLNSVSTYLLNEEIAKDESNLGRGYRIGHSFFVPTNEIVDSQSANANWMNQILRYEILPLIEEYYCDDPDGRDSALGKILG